MCIVHEYAGAQCNYICLLIFGRTSIVLKSKNKSIAIGSKSVVKEQHSADLN